MKFGGSAADPLYVVQTNAEIVKRCILMTTDPGDLVLASIANKAPPGEETLYDQPEVDAKRLRIVGPFTVETLQAYEPVSPAALAAARKSDAELGKFEDVVFEHLKSAGVKTGDKKENAVFRRPKIPRYVVIEEELHCGSSGPSAICLATKASISVRWSS